MNFFKDENFERVLEGIEKNYLTLVTTIFLRNKIPKNSVKLSEKMLSSYQTMQFLYSYLDFFPENCGELSNGHGEDIHLGVANIEKRYQCK